MVVSCHLNAPADLPSKKYQQVPFETGWTLSLPEIEPRFLGRPNHTLVAVPTELSRLRVGTRRKLKAKCAHR
jgi:hypothetical protein